MNFKRYAAIAAIVAGAGLAGTAQAEGDAASGEKVFRKCKACHQVGPDAKARTGPILNGVIGRTAGTAEFDYSDAMVEAGAGGLVWTEETMSEFLEKPKSYLDGTKMSFAGLRKEEDRADVIAYLATFE